MVDGRLFKMKIQNWISGESVGPISNSWLEKVNPHNGDVISHLALSSEEDCNVAVDSCLQSFRGWSSTTPVTRGDILFAVANEMKKSSELLAHLVSLETGKSFKDASGEVEGAIKLAHFFAGEGMRLYSRTLPSNILGKTSFTVREPHGVVALIVPANTPIANIAWKVFPALICGNCAVLKASEDAPATAMEFAKITKAAGLPNGVLNVLQGDAVAGRSLVKHSQVSLISFTGSTKVGKEIACLAGERMARVSLELGGKNAIIICEDADLENAVSWTIKSAFSNAGQRCASASRIIVTQAIYDEFTKILVERVKNLRLGIDDTDDLGPVINKNQHKNILQAIKTAKEEGGSLLCGGCALEDSTHKKGFYITPTLLENVGTSSHFTKNEIFGPVAAIYRVSNLCDAIDLANSSEYGLTSAIHTRDINKALFFAKHIKSGVANINMGTYGSEPHMPFGGFGCSGNGTREPGVEALDVYSELKNISFLSNL